MGVLEGFLVVGERGNLEIFGKTKWILGLVLRILGVCGV
jgi:hypothetical protein